MRLPQKLNRSLIFLVPLFALLGGTVGAQEDARRDLKRLELTDVQMSQVVDVVQATQSDLAKYRAEAAINQAKLTRLLLEDTPSKADIEKLLRDGLEWDLKIKQARIDRSLKLRAIVGKERWASLSSLAQRIREQEKAGKQLKLWREDDKPAARELLKLLKDLN